MKFLLICFLFISIFTSCASNDSKKKIEGLLEIPLPECYIEVDNPTKENENALEVTELHFEEECFDQFINDIGKQGPSAYCGTTSSVEITMAFCTLDESARMTINTETRVLHFEKLKEK
ncbi:MAG: hypothetical protein MI810_20900 [Flavobacteriales bacterium]|nr:hypothetical protein [Flavobacteriales bacterium]